MNNFRTQNELVSLDCLKVGERGVVEKYSRSGSVEGRLKEVGIVRGTIVEVKRFAPLGDPMELVVRGYQLAIRKSDAAGILVQRLNGKSNE